MNKLNYMEREILAWAKQGLHEGTKEMRWCNLIGPHTKIRALNNSTLEVRTEMNVWELRLVEVENFGDGQL